MKFFKDPGCTEALESIKWNNTVEVALVGGKKESLENTATAGETATATCYLKNEGKHPYFVTRISHPDPKIKFTVESAFISPSNAVKIEIEFPVPDKFNDSDVVKAGDILVEGFFRKLVMQ